MKTKLALATALAAALMLALFLVGCGGTAQTHPRTVKDVDLTKYTDLEVGNLVVILPNGTEKKYDVASDFWAEQAEDSLWFYDEYKYALVVEKEIITGGSGNNGNIPGEYSRIIVVGYTGSGEGGILGTRGLRVGVDEQTAWSFKTGDTVIVCGNIPDSPRDAPMLSRNTQVVAA